MIPNHWAKLIKNKLGHSSTGLVNVWVTFLYVLLEDENGQSIKYKLKDIPILDKYKKYENEILNDTYLKESNNNNTSDKDNKQKTDNSMPKKARKPRKPRKKVKIDVETQKSIDDFDSKQEKWWNASHREIIEDYHDYIKTEFAVKKIKGSENTYEMLNINGQHIGIIRPWVDVKNEYPAKYKNEDNVIQLSEDGEPEYEYCLDKNSPFHDMPKIVYHKYTYCDIFNKFILTNEIFKVE